MRAVAGLLLALLAGCAPVTDVQPSPLGYAIHGSRYQVPPLTHD